MHYITYKGTTVTKRDIIHARTAGYEIAREHPFERVTIHKVRAEGQGINRPYIVGYVTYMGIGEGTARDPAICLYLDERGYFKLLHNGQVKVLEC